MLSTLDPADPSGISPLTARNFEGHGVRVIVLGEKGKGGAELCDSKNVKYEDWWTKKRTSKLVKTRWVDVFRDLLPIQG
jgi:fatty acid synthase subunit beta